MTKSGISIIIPNLLIDDKIQKLAENTIASFKRTTMDFELILVDDGSTQGSDMLKKEADIYVRNKKNLGYPPSVNKGWKKAKGKYIVTANNDIEVFPNWQEDFIRLIEQWEADFIGGLGVRTRMLEGMLLEKYKENVGWNPNQLSFGGQLRDWMFPGGFWMMKREVFDKIGYFDENFQHGGYEDVDYFYRAKQAGLKLLMTSLVVYWHLEGATRFSETQKGIQSEVDQHNLQYFIDKHGFDPRKEMFNKIFREVRINL